ncbi:hypothetical protein PInf_015616 [Phytophthora infestans]|nr:hypothetical protein PInf_015616 [Phytophthora infestans]
MMQGASLNAATEAGITTVRLPIQEHYTERLDHILNVNTVVDVLIKFGELGDWPRALDIALPQRKRSQFGRKAIRRRQKQQMLQNSCAETQAKDSVPTHAKQSTIKHHSVRSDATDVSEAELSPTQDLSLWLDQHNYEDKNAVGCASWKAATVESKQEADVELMEEEHSVKSMVVRKLFIVKGCVELTVEEEA